MQGDVACHGGPDDGDDPKAGDGRQQPPDRGLELLELVRGGKVGELGQQRRKHRLEQHDGDPGDDEPGEELPGQGFLARRRQQLDRHGRQVQEELGEQGGHHEVAERGRQLAPLCLGARRRQPPLAGKDQGVGEQGGRAERQAVGPDRFPADACEDHDGQEAGDTLEGHQPAVGRELPVAREVAPAKVPHVEARQADQECQEQDALVVEQVARDRGGHHRGGDGHIRGVLLGVRAPPRTTARCTTGHAPNPFARRAAIARETSCSRGMKTPGPAMNPRIQSAARSEY